MQAVDDNLENEMKAGRKKLSAALVVKDDDEVEPGCGRNEVASEAIGARTTPVSVVHRLFSSGSRRFGYGFNLSTASRD